MKRRAAWFVVSSLLLLVPAGAWADKSDAKKSKASSSEPPTTIGPNGQKSKNYTFTGLDIDGKLKTPQLLYFLNRMKSEFDSTTPEHRSFLPELERSTSEM